MFFRSHRLSLKQGSVLGAVGALMLAAAPAWAGTVPPERITISGNEFRVCNNTQRIWMGGANTPWFLWNDFGNASFNINTWSSHYQTLIDNKINSSRVWITCSGEVGINISTGGVVGTGTPGSGGTAKHWQDLDAFFAMAQTRKMYVKATLMSFDHFKSSYSTYTRWRNWINSSANVESYISTYLTEFLNRYGNNPYLWSIDLINEPEWASESENTGDCAQHGCIQWSRFQYAWGRMAKVIHDWNAANGHGPLVTVGMGFVKHLSNRVGGSNKVSDAILTAPANGNAANAKLDYWDVHYYLWQQAQVGNPFTQTPNTFFNATLDRPAMLGENPNDGGSDSDPPSAQDGPRTLLNDINDAYANGWQGFAPWTSNNAGSGNFGDWDNDINDATIPFDSAHPGLMFPACAAVTPTRTRTPTRTPTPGAGGGPYLKTYADPCGINVGAAVVWSAFNSGPQIYRDTLEQNFNLVEPENEMKWGELRPNQATFNYTKSDTLITWAQARGMKIRGHVLAWHQDNPGWLTGGGFNAAQMSNLLQTHINTVMAHYAGKVYAWDVVNEAFNEDGTLRTSVWHGAPGIGITGTGWIEQAFRWARAADPSAELYYNDYNNELSGYAKGDAVYAMAVDFVNRGVPIDGIGMQVHVVAGSGFPNPAAVRNQINRITALGLYVEITELDVRIQEPVDATKLAQQAATAQAIIDACLDNPLCKTIQWWGHTDNYSWIPGTFPGYNDGLLLDRSYNPKPVYNTFLGELNRPCLNPPGSPTRTRTPTPVPFTELFDDFEDGNTGNNWGGTWSPYAGTASAVTLTVAGPGAPGSANARANVTGNIGDYGGITAGFNTATRNLSSYIGIRFQVRGSGTHWWQAPQSSISDGDHFGAAFTATGAWTTVTIYFNTLTQRGFGAGATFDPTVITSFQWASNANGAFNFEIDDVQLLTYSPPATATRTPTRTPSRTATRTSTRTASPTPSRTATRTGTRSATPTPTSVPATATFTATRTATRTGTPTLTPVPATFTFTATLTGTRTSTPSSTPTRTGTPTLTPLPATFTFTATRTATPSSSPSSTRTVTGTRTASPTVSGTPFGSPTHSPTVTPTPSGTRTSTPSVTPSVTPSSSPTATRTGTPTATRTPSTSTTPSPTGTLGAGSPTVSPTLTATATRTATPSVTVSPTVSDTPFGSPTHSPTQSPSATRSTSPTPSPTASPTATPSLTATRTVSSLPSSTATPSLTATRTVSSLPSPTATPSLTATRTVSSLPSSTATPSLTATRTVSSLPSPTATPSLTATRTVSSLPSPTATPSLTATRTVSPLPSPTATPSLTAPPTSTSTPVVPNVLSLSPSGPVAVGVTLTVQGSNFAPGAQVVVNGTGYGATWVGPGTLTLAVPALPAGSYSLTVRNPDNYESAAGPALVIAGPAPTATPEPFGPLVIESAVAWPNPGPKAVLVKLGGPAQRLRLKVYTQAWVLVGVSEAGPVAKGWARVAMPSELAQAPRGTYYFVVQAHDGERQSQPRTGRFFQWQ